MEPNRPVAAPSPRSRAALRQALDAWVEQHGYIWFEGDLALAAAIAQFLGINLELDGLAVAGEVPGVTQK